MGHHGLWGRKVVGEVEGVDEVAAPIGELAATGFPERAPATRRDVIAVRDFVFQGASPEVPIEVRGDGLCGRVFAPRIGEVGAFLYASRPNPRFDGAPQLVFAEDFDGLHSAFDAGALVAHLSDERGASRQGFSDGFEFIKLLDERFLSVKVFVVL